MKDTRTRLLEAARALMIERGVLEVSIAEICQRADANVALVSYHFSGREGLMLAVVRSDAEMALADLDKLLAKNLSASEKIKRHVIGIVRAYYQRPYLNRLIMKLLREGTRQAAEQVAEFFARPVTNARCEIIAQGIKSGEFRKVDSELVSIAIDGACAQIFTSAEARETVLGTGELDEALLERYAKSTANLIVAGLRRNE